MPLKQWAFDDSHSPKYQKFKIDKLPKIISYKQDWDWKDLIGYYEQRYHKTIKPVFRHGECNVPEDLRCFSCNVPFHYLMWNDGKNRPRSYAKYANLVSSLMLKQIFKNACLEMPSLQPHSRTYERPQTLRYT